MHVVFSKLRRRADRDAIGPCRQRGVSDRHLRTVFSFQKLSVALLPPITSPHGTSLHNSQAAGGRPLPDLNGAEVASQACQALGS